MKETQAKRAAAQARLTKRVGRRRMPRDEITGLVQSIGNVMQATRDADPSDKAELYSQLGLTLTYHPNEKRIMAEAGPESIMYADPSRSCT